MTTTRTLAIRVNATLKGEEVAAALNRIAAGCPLLLVTARYRPLTRFIQADNGSAFLSKALDKWAYENGVEI